MATNSTLKNQLTKKNTGAVTPGNTVKGLLDSQAMKLRFEQVLDKKAPQFMSSVLNLVNGDTNLQKCEPLSIISSAMVAATLDLPIDKNLGYAWVVPYGNKASFQLGWKGYIQLALRTSQYKAINVIEVREGELVEFNPLTEELTIDFTKKTSDAVVGYAGYFKLVNGFEKTIYWSKEQVQAHAKKFSKTYSFGNGVWKTDFDAMAKKTVLRNMLSKWGILSIDMQNAYTADSNTVKKEILEDVNNIQGSIEHEEIIDTDFKIDETTGEIFEGSPLE